MAVRAHMHLVFLGIEASIDHLRRDGTISTEVLANICWREWIVVGRLLWHLSTSPKHRIQEKHMLENT